MLAELRADEGRVRVWRDRTLGLPRRHPMSGAERIAFQRWDVALKEQNPVVLKLF